MVAWQSASMASRRRKRIGEQLCSRNSARALRRVWGGWVQAQAAEKQACPAATSKRGFLAGLHCLSRMICTGMASWHCRLARVLADLRADPRWCGRSE